MQLLLLLLLLLHCVMPVGLTRPADPVSGCNVGNVALSIAHFVVEVDYGLQTRHKFIAS